MPTGTLVITRPRQIADMMRRYRIILDGHEVGAIRRGEELRLDVPAGEHDVVARIDWTSSSPLRVRVDGGRETEIEVGSNVSGWRLLAASYFITFGASQYLYLRHRHRAFPVVALKTGG